MSNTLQLETKIGRTWYKRLTEEWIREPIPYHQILAFRDVLAVANGGIASKARTLTQGDASKLEYLFEELKASPTTALAITRENDQKGRDWVRAKYRKLKRMGFPVDEVLGCECFTLAGYYQWTSGGFPRASDYFPIWRAHLADGGMVQYHTTPWQAGSDTDWLTIPALVGMD